MESRVIKFRAWDGEKMVCPDYIDRGGVAWWKENSIPTSSKVVMQSTGLTDKNKKEIYQNDILKSTDDGRNGIKFYYIVEWGSHAWTVRHYQSKSKSNATAKSFFKNGRVIGNIYANPELL